jgi:hypothetical protein
MKIKLSLELECESWMEKSIEPKTKQEWTDFFMKYLIESPKSIIGNNQEIIALHNCSIEVTEVEYYTRRFF